MSEAHLLEVNHLVAKLNTRQGLYHILNDVNFYVDEEECFGIIGESGCGKTMTSMAILRYAEKIGLEVTNGEILYKGENVLNYNKKQLQKYNGKEVAIIMQDPMQALDPLYTVQDQILETIREHRGLSKKESIAEMKKITAQLSISEEKLKCYPHQLSGGMLQRIVGAIVVACRPKLIIADEPTTALDVTIQLQYLRLLKDIQKIYHTSIIFISHDIHVISMMCDRIAVMYAGRIVESGTKEEVFEHPKHPYTKALFKAASMGEIPQDKYDVIDGAPPKLTQEIKGCAFADRCGYANEKCISNIIPVTKLEGQHKVACLRHQN